MIELKDIPSLTFNKPARDIDYAKEFVLDTPWMLKESERDEYIFAYACCYMPARAQPMIGFGYGEKSKSARFTLSCKYARHLTKEEEIKYLGAEK